MSKETYLEQPHPRGELHLALRWCSAGDAESIAGTVEWNPRPELRVLRINDNVLGINSDPSRGSDSEDRIQMPLMRHAFFDTGTGPTQHRCYSSIDVSIGLGEKQDSSTLDGDLI